MVQTTPAADKSQGLPTVATSHPVQAVFGAGGGAEKQRLLWVTLWEYKDARKPTQRISKALP